MAKTSLIIDDNLFKAAAKEAEASDTSISQVISRWAVIGRNAERVSATRARVIYRPRDLGAPLLTLRSRNEWMDALDEVNE